MSKKAENTPLQMPEKGLFANLKYDIPASVVVFLVATPLCLGIALASGAPLFAGIIAGIVGGIIVGMFSGSEIGVSGPAAGLAVIVYNAIDSLGGWEIFLLAVFLAGFMQLALGYLRAGIIGYYFPSSVIKGMLSGIGIFIALKQIPYIFGYKMAKEGSLFSELVNMISNIQPGAVLITLISLGLLVLWEQPFMKKQKIFQLIQGPLVVVVLGIVLNQILLAVAPNLALTGTNMVDIPVSEGISGFLGLFTTPDFTQLTNPAIYTVAFTIAVVASLETLLCVEATDKLDPYRRITPTNRELKAQGIGNIVSGLIGGLPVTQVIVRSSANIQSGGRSKMSAIIHGFLLLFAAMLIPNLLNMIPLATLAAILILVGYKLAKPVLFKEMYQRGWSQFIPFMVTILGIVFIDLLIGIGLGLAVAIFFILKNNFQNPYFFTQETRDSDDAIVIKLSEDVTFLNRASIMQTLDEVPAGTKLVIDATRSVNIDFDVKEIILEFREKAKLNNIELTILGFENGHVPNKNDDAVKEVRKVLQKRKEQISNADLVNMN